MQRRDRLNRLAHDAEPPCQAPSDRDRGGIVAAFHHPSELYDGLLRLQSAMGEGLAVCEDNRIVYANEALARLYGCTIAELLALPSGFEGPGESDVGLYERIIVRKGGEQIRVECAETTLRLGDRVQRLILVRDITRQKTAEEHERALLCEQAARLKAETAKRTSDHLAQAAVLLGASLNDPKALPRLARCVSEWMDGSCRINLLTEDGKGLLPAGVYHPDPDGLALLAEMNGREATESTPSGQVIRTGRALLIPHLSADTPLKSADPKVLAYLTRFPVHSLLVVAIRAREKIIGTITVLRHRGHPPLGEDDQRFMEALADRAGLAIDNAQLHEHSLAAIAARDAFMSIAAHELRTPLSALVLQLSSLGRWVEGLDFDLHRAKFNDKLKKAVRQTDRLTKLIENLLDVSRIATGRLTLEFERFDLGDVVRETIERFSDEAHRAGCRIDLGMIGNTTGLWDRSRMEQIATNLLSNALTYGAGYPVEIALAEAGEDIVLQVRDQGIGIAPGDLARIFDRFERAVSTRHYGGLGLGLFITRQIVEAHAGTITVTSTPGAGATFIVSIPREVAR